MRSTLGFAMLVFAALGCNHADADANARSGGRGAAVTAGKARSYH
jgi:hypothetical protein